MPTSFTYKLIENPKMTLEEFAMNCSRAFGALIPMRDLPVDAPIPEKFEPSEHLVNKVKELHERHQVLMGYTPTDASREAENVYNQERKAFKKAIEDKNQQNDTICRMYDEVEAWEAPTCEHNPLKAFMLEQLNSSYERYNPVKPIRQSGEAWLKKELENSFYDIKYYEKKLEEEIIRTDERNAWLSVLRQSLALNAKIICPSCGTKDLEINNNSAFCQNCDIEIEIIFQKAPNG